MQKWSFVLNFVFGRQRDDVMKMLPIGSAYLLICVFIDLRI
jgi:hypothetical protein